MLCLRTTTGVGYDELQKWVGYDDVGVLCKACVCGLSILTGTLGD